MSSRKTVVAASSQKVQEQQTDPMVASESFQSHDYYDYDYYPSSASSKLVAALRLRRQRQAALLNQGLAKRQSLAATSASGSDLSSQGTSAYGSYSHHGYHDCDNGISLGLLLTALLGIGVMFFTLFTKITMAGKRKKRDVDELSGVNDPLGMILERFQDFVFGGNVEDRFIGF